jgi:hypothetical protein
MNISDKYKLIFFHYPKCAGKSAINALGIKTSDKTNVQSGLRQTIGYGVDYYHWNNLIYPEKWDTYKKFTIVRNPWDRVVSLYNFRKKENDLYNLLPSELGCDLLGGTKIGPDGEHWVFKKWLLSIFAKGLNGGSEFEIPRGLGLSKTKMLDYDSNTLEKAFKSHEFLNSDNFYNNMILEENPITAIGPTGEKVEMLLYNLLRERIEWFNQIDVMSQVNIKNNDRFNGEILVDYIIKFENLNSDWDDMFGKLGYEAPKLPVLNKYKHKHYSEYYDDETREFVGWLFKKDIDAFGYKFKNGG